MPLEVTIVATTYLVAVACENILTRTAHGTKDHREAVVKSDHALIKLATTCARHKVKLSEAIGHVTSSLRIDLDLGNEPYDWPDTNDPFDHPFDL